MGDERPIGRHHEATIGYLCKRCQGAFNISCGLDGAFDQLDRERSRQRFGVYHIVCKLSLIHI